MSDCQLILCGHGETKDFTVMCLLNAVKTAKHNYEVVYQSGDALIGRSRSIACTAFLKTNLAPFMIFIDTDIMFSVEELDRLYESMASGYDVIAGAYCVGTGERLAIRGLTDNVIIDGRIIEVEYISTGFMGISRKALETIKDKLNMPILHKGDWCECYPFFESVASNLNKELYYASPNLQRQLFYISEDWDFCNKARAAGFKTYFHTGVLVDHIKQRIITPEEMLNRNKQLMSDAQAHPEVNLINDVAEFLGKSYEETKVAILNYQVKDNKTDDEWLIELAQFNSRDYYMKQRVAPLMGVQGLKILDYGCGIGTTAFALSPRNPVTGYDINKRLIDFCNYRLKKQGYLNATFISEEPDLSQFDIITFIDVLEHFQDLESFLKHIREKTKAGTKLYHFDAFFDHATPGHFDHSAKINDYLKEAGFIPFDPLWAVKVDSTPAIEKPTEKPIVAALDNDFIPGNTEC